MRDIVDEALNKLHKQAVYCCANESEIYDCDENKKIIKQALKHNEPMKVIQTYNEQDYRLFDCPHCHGTYYYEDTTEGWNFCMGCGQALSWGDEK